MVDCIPSLRDCVQNNTRLCTLEIFLKKIRSLQQSRNVFRQVSELFSVKQSVHICICLFLTILYIGGADYFYQLLMADISKIVSPYYRFLFLYHVLYLIYTLVMGIAIWFGNSEAAKGAKEATVRNIYLSGIVIWGFMTFKPFVVIGFAVLTWIL